MSPKSTQRLVRLLPIFLIASSVSACASRSSTREVQIVAASAASLKVTVPPLARERCVGARLPASPKPGEPEYQIFGMRQTDKLEQCDEKRALAVEASDLHNTYVDRLTTELRPPTFWERIVGKRRP